MKKYSLIFLLLLSTLNLNADKSATKKFDVTEKFTKTEAAVLKELSKKVDDLKALLKTVDQKDSAPGSKTEATISSDKSKIAQITNVLKDIFFFIEERFKFIVDKSDKILSKKFIIASLLLLGPAIITYCKFFDPTILERIIKKITGAAASGGVKIAKNVAEEVIDKTKDELLNDKKTWLKIVGAWFGLSAAKEVFIKTVEKIGEGLGPNIASTVIWPTTMLTSYLTHPYMLPVSVTTFILHRYYHH